MTTIVQGLSEWLWPKPVQKHPAGAGGASEPSPRSVRRVPLIPAADLHRLEDELRAAGLSRRDATRATAIFKKWIFS